MQTPKPCWSFHMNPLLNTSPHWTTKYFSVNKYRDINNIWRAGQQAVRVEPLLHRSVQFLSRRSSLAEGHLRGDCEIIVHSITDWIAESSPLTMILLASKMCPAGCQLGVNYRPTGPTFVVLESGVWGSTLSTCHSRRFLLLTLNTLSKCSDSSPK